MSTGTKKPSIEAQAPQSYVQVDAGIYRYKDKEGKPPTTNDRPSMGSKLIVHWDTTSPHKPISSLRERNTTNAGRLFPKEKTPYAEQKPEATPAAHTPSKTDSQSGSGPQPNVSSQTSGSPEKTVGDVIRKYQGDGYPNKYKQKRQGKNLQDEERHSKKLLEYWELIPVANCGPAECDRYHDWRDEESCPGQGQQDYGSRTEHA